MKSYYIYILLAAFFLLGCTENENSSGLDNRIPVGGQDGVSTLAAGTQWENGDVIGLYMTDAGTADIVENISNYPYETTGNGVFGPADSKKIGYYPVDGSPVDLFAYYPWSGTITGNGIPVDVTNQTDPDMDLLTAYSGGHSNRLTDVDFTFYHRLAKLSFILDNSANGVTIAGATITIKGVYLQADYKLIEDKLTPKGNKTDINVPQVGGNYSIILLPGTVETGVEFLVTLADGSTFTAIPTVGSEFKSGVNNKFTLKLLSQPIQVSATISDWDDETVPPIEAEAIVPDADESLGFADGKILAMITSGQSLAKYTYNSTTKKWDTTNALVWRYDYPTMDFRAIYPYGTALAGDVNAMTINLADQTGGTSDFEYVVANQTGIVPTDQKLHLNFDYVLTMLEFCIIIKPQNGEIIRASDLNLKMENAYSTGFYKLDADASSALTRDNTTGTITSYVVENTDNNITADFIARTVIFPGQSNMKVVLTANNISYEATISKDYAGGKKYINELTLQNGKISLSASMPDKWEPGEDHKGEFN